ncbi:hypothetical protein FGE12_29640 [Aggregicoccus sp. 17bor-14]|uniref:hypothetical protein n=1 Tax=Myxococcaceae TaxID=31 RepID=UPI00129D0A8E|nr:MULTISPECIES: hypothetical protein [Myxococcaceae]MBF5046618.1 hypothetical protein [Simulacricoccus sp. 17bor-14]MRI92328.1 hypothetical protein [Aggregicoccus sp. 17bor-14]
MDATPHTRGWQARWVWVGGLAALALSFALTPFLSGGCEVSFREGESGVLPFSFPWNPTTHEGWVTALRIVAVADVVVPVMGWLGVTLLLGALWSRVVQSRRICWAIALVPSAGAVLHLIKAGLFHLYATGPNGPSDRVYVLVWHWLPSAGAFLISSSLVLLLLGALVLLARRLRTLRPRTTA